MGRNKLLPLVGRIAAPRPVDARLCTEPKMSDIGEKVRPPDVVVGADEYL
jgi:hypothetical protein